MKKTYYKPQIKIYIPRLERSWETIQTRNRPLQTGAEQQIAEAKQPIGVAVIQKVTSMSGKNRFD